MSTERHHPTIRALHWLIAALVLTALVMSTVVMPHIPNSDPAKITALIRHMSAGGLIAMVALLRLFVRRKTDRPASLSSGMPWADRLASVMHPLLDGLVFVMVGSGIGMAVISGLPAIVLGGQGSLPARFDTLPLHSLHAFTADLLIAALVLHVGGALYHQFILADGLLSRMGLGSGKNGAGQSDKLNPAMSMLDN